MDKLRIGRWQILFVGVISTFFTSTWVLKKFRQTSVQSLLHTLIRKRPTSTYKDFQYSTIRLQRSINHLDLHFNDQKCNPKYYFVFMKYTFTQNFAKCIDFTFCYLAETTLKLSGDTPKSSVFLFLYWETVKLCCIYTQTFSTIFSIVILELFNIFFLKKWPRPTRPKCNPKLTKILSNIPTLTHVWRRKSFFNF